MSLLILAQKAKGKQFTVVGSVYSYRDALAKREKYLSKAGGQARIVEELNPAEVYDRARMEPELLPKTRKPRTPRQPKPAPAE